MTKDEILNMLRSASAPISGEEMSRALGVSRAAVWKAVDQLRQEGYAIEAATRRGYRLAALPDRLDAALVRSFLPEHPWADKPEFSVFRHASNKKWFALFMTVKASLLGLPGAEEVPVLNLKADPRLIGSQREKPGFFPAYHMNKEHWITAALDGSAPEDEIKILLAMSYDLTAMTRAFRKNTILP